MYWRLTKTADAVSGPTRFSPISAVACTIGTNISDDRLNRLSGSDPGCR
jgi:hypothetical protein